jgi:hydroxymethylpyrimidine/phosphomethylpyrimidine kinase
VRPRILTIAGSDSGGGAGIQADLKTITLLGGYGMSAVTALTAQNTLGVSGIHEIPPEFVARQMEAVLGDIGADAAKTGMVGGADILTAVCRKLRQFRVRNLVVDPVMVSKSGARLLKPEAEDALRRELIPLATVVTPNIPEAEVLTGRRIRTAREMKAAAARIQKMGAGHVLIKGGHLRGPAVDLLYDGERFLEFAEARIGTPHTHGTGCTLSAAIAVGLGRGQTVREAVASAKQFLTAAIRMAAPLGHGRGPVDHYGPIRREIEKYEVIRRLKEVFRSLRRGNIAALLPEVQSNLGYALPDAQGFGDVAAFPGRFVRVGEELTQAADPDFGASRHIAQIILTAMAHDPEMRAAMNVRYGEEILARARKAGLAVKHFSRRDEPPAVKRREGSSLSWGVEAVLKRSRKTPDIIFDRGDVGKEPMIRVLGRSPEEVAEKVLRLR